MFSILSSGIVAFRCVTTLTVLRIAEIEAPSFESTTIRKIDIVMAPQTRSSEKKSQTVGLAPARSPPLTPVKTVKKHKDYTSEGVADHDVLLLPGSDYQVMIVVTILAAIVRLFRIYQPSSVVFDEVQ